MDAITVLGVVVGVAATILAVVVRMAKNHIDRRVEQLCTESLGIEVEKAVTSAMTPIGTKLDTLHTQVNNGLTDRQRRIEGLLDRLVEHFLDGAWDGRERRDHGSD